MPAGRPSKYDPKYCEEILEWFDRPLFEETTHYGKTVRKYNKIPTLLNYAISIGVHKDTLLEWTKVHPEFSVAYKQAKQMQEDILLQGGMTKVFDPKFCWLMGKNMAGWRDEKHLNHENKEVSLTIKRADGD